MAAGYSDLIKIAEAIPEQIIADTAEVISKYNMELKIPLLKEVKTHIAVAKALTIYKTDKGENR